MPGKATGIVPVHVDLVDLEVHFLLLTDSEPDAGRPHRHDCGLHFRHALLTAAFVDPFKQRWAN